LPACVIWTLTLKSNIMPKPKRKHAKTKSPKQKPLSKLQTKPVASTSQRKLKKPVYKSFRRHKKIKSDLPPLTGSFRLFWRSLNVLKRHITLILGILLIYGLLNLFLVHGLSSNGDLPSLKSSLNNVFKTSGGQFSSSLTLFIYLLGGSSNTSSTNSNAGIIQLILIILVSLAFIWTLRQIYASQKVRSRDGFYLGIYPLIPFVLVLVVIALQLLPMIFGGYVYGVVIAEGIAAYVFEKILWGLLFFFLALLSLYMISSSVFALYIVTLPDMTPMKSLKSARELVRYRRWTVLRKLIFLPIILLIISAIIMLPVLIFYTPGAEWLYFLLTIGVLAVIHSYVYALYRELLP